MKKAKGYSAKEQEIIVTQAYNMGFIKGYNLAIDKIKDSFIHVSNNVNHDYTSKVILTLISDFETLKLAEPEEATLK